MKVLGDVYTQQHMTYDNILQGMVSEVYSLDDMLIPGRSVAWQEHTRLLTAICHGKGQLDQSWYNNERNGV